MKNYNVQPMKIDIWLEQENLPSDGMVWFYQDDCGDGIFYNIGRLPEHDIAAVCVEIEHGVFVGLKDGLVLGEMSRETFEREIEPHMESYPQRPLD
jgi:hypothetical protein